MKRPALLLVAILAVGSTDNRCAENVPDLRKASVGQMAKEFSKLGVHKIYVPDFCDGSSRPNDHGAFFAAVFSDLLTHKAKGFAVASRIDVHRFLLQSNLTDCDLERPSVLSNVSSQFGVDSVLSASLSGDSNTNRLDFILKDLSGKELLRFQHTEPRPAMEGIFPATSAPSGWPFYFPMFDGVKHPNCIACPSVMDQHFDGTVQLSGLITAKGKVEQVRIIKTLRPDLDELSLKAVNTWLFEPAKAPDGSSVPVRIVFEISFHPSFHP